MAELFAALPQDEPDGQQDALFPDLSPSLIAAPPGYRVLARKYRPVTFSQLIGQDAMVRTLANAIETGRLPHAWMLTGVRGIGKTTTARIIARALNCTGPDGKGGPTITPCGQCDACRGIMDDRNVDVLEMDAASRTGVDDIRDIIDGVRYGPVGSRYKIYILDEVHMLSKNAFNALLKTLEEPPPHTKFIFATTEIRKVPVTVLSRCQRFDLRRIGPERLAAHFAAVAEWENVSAEPEALKLIAQAADGSVRDGLSLLDQAIARGNGAVVTTDAKDMLGLADRAHSISLCRHLLRGAMKPALDELALMYQAGADPVQILQDMCDLVHLLTRGQVIKDFAADASLPDYDRQLLVDCAEIKLPALTRAWQLLLKGITEVQTAPQPSQAAEMVLIRLAYAAELPPPAELIKQLRDHVAATPAASSSTGHTGGGEPPRALRTGTGSTSVATAAVATQTMAAADPALPASPTSFKDLVALFDLNKEGALHAQLYGNVSPVRLEPGLLEIQIGPYAPPNFAARIGQCLTQWTGRRWMVSIAAGAPVATLALAARQAEQARAAKARAHPLMQAAMQTFPDAQLLSVKHKAVVVAPAAGTVDGVEDLPPDSD